MIIRRAESKDAKWIYEILNNNYEFRNEDNGKEEYPISWVKGVIKSRKGNIVLIGEKNNEAIGFFIGHIILGANDFIINNLYIEPDYRKKSFGTQLFKEGQKIAIERGCRFIAGLVNLKNIKSQKFLSRLGYRKGNKFIIYWKWLRC